MTRADRHLYGKLGLSAAELKEVSQSLQNQIPARRFRTPREIASAVVYLASGESAFTVGSDLIIDGGLGLEATRRAVVLSQMLV